MVGGPMIYNRMATLRVVNRSHVLAEIYLEHCVHASVDYALRWVFENYIVTNPSQWKALYDSMNDGPTMQQYTYPLVDELEALIKKHSWADFKSALEQLAKNKAELYNYVGLTNKGKRWANIRERLSAIPRYVNQLEIEGS